MERVSHCCPEYVLGKARAHRTTASHRATHSRATPTVQSHLPRAMPGRPARENATLQEHNRLRLPPHGRRALRPGPVPVPEPPRPVVGEGGSTRRVEGLQSTERRQRKPSQRGSRERRMPWKCAQIQRGPCKRQNLCLCVRPLRGRHRLAPTRKRHSTQARQKRRTGRRECMPPPRRWLPHVLGQRHQRNQTVLGHTGRVDTKLPRWQLHPHRTPRVRERHKHPRARRAQRRARPCRDQASLAHARVNRLAQPVNLYLTQRMKWVREGSAGKHG